MMKKYFVIIFVLALTTLAVFGATKIVFAVPKDSGLSVIHKPRRPRPTHNPSVTPTPQPTPTPAGELVLPFMASGQLPGVWNLKFHDEFEGIVLDSVWEPSWFAGTSISPPINTEEDGCYDPTQVSVVNGTLRLAAISTTNSNCKVRSGASALYASGMVNSRIRTVNGANVGYKFSYGYMEARINTPGDNGMMWNWPAFWSDGTGKWPITGEIDVVEGLSEHLPCWHYHYQDSNGVEQSPGGCVDSSWGDPVGWHIYGALWEPGKITYYYDGKQVGLISQGIVSDAQFLILNFGLNNSYGIHVPAVMEVDYVRVWQQ